MKFEKPFFTRRQLAVIAISSTFLLTLYFMRLWRTDAFMKCAPGSAGIWVEVRGDVDRPGIYRITNQKTTIKTAAREVKGISRLPLSQIDENPNLLKKVKNGDLLIVHKTPEGNFDIEKQRMTGAKCLAIGILMPINSANEQDLLCLPGMNLKVAQNIVNYRIEHGPFHTIQELQKVSGVGPKSIQRWEPFLRFERAPQASPHQSR